MNKEIALIYLSSMAIKNYCAKHPIDWKTQEQAKSGDILTPTPAMGVFFDLLTDKGGLFSQEDYVDYAFSLPSWSEWMYSLPAGKQAGIAARLYRNFYPSAIDSLHSWSLLVETGQFAACLLDTADDAVSKTDLTVWTINGKSAKIALYVGTKEGMARTQYKRTHRGSVNGVIDVILSMDRKPWPGRKRWYTIDDFAPVFEYLSMGNDWNTSWSAGYASL